MWKACLTVVSRRADSLETLINRGEHIGANVVFHVDDERMNFNFVEKVQGRSILGVSLSETKKKKKKKKNAREFDVEVATRSTQSMKSWKRCPRCWRDNQSAATGAGDKFRDGGQTGQGGKISVGEKWEIIFAWGK